MQAMMIWPDKKGHSGTPTPSQCFWTISTLWSSVVIVHFLGTTLLFLGIRRFAVLTDPYSTLNLYTAKPHPKTAEGGNPERQESLVNPHFLLALFELVTSIYIIGPPSTSITFNLFCYFL